MGAGKPWPLAKAAAVRAALEARAAAEVAEELGCTVNNMYRRLRTADDPIGRRIYTHRTQGRSFDEIAALLNMEVGPQASRRLYMRLVRYCERAELAYPKVEKPAIPWRERIDAATLDRIVGLLEERAGRLEDSDNVVVEDALQLSSRDVKLHLAELRRRGWVANGIVPTPEGIAIVERWAATSTPALCAFDAVLCAVVEAWASGAPCETLRSLGEKLSFSHSTLNLAIVRLRDAGLLARRGTLHLRIPR